MSAERPSKLRPLLPSPAEARAPPPAAAPQPLASIGVIPKRIAVATACESCRKRKTRCNGGRPKCADCIKRKLECHYETKPNETQSQAAKRKLEEFQNHETPYELVFNALRDRSEGDAGSIVQRIRRGDSIRDVARQIEFGDILIQSSLTPETRYRYDFPLSSAMPQHLLQQSNPYLASLIYEWASSLVGANVTSASASASASASTPVSSHNAQDAASTELYAPYLKPYHAAEIVDTQLSAVRPSQWTTVCTDDVLMRKLLSAYLLQDHEWWTTFHKDYFLEDMAKMHNSFCTPLLVNTVLALACNSYYGLANRAEFWNPQTLGYRFLAEAKRLWEYELPNSKLTTIHAALTFHLIYAACGADKIGYAYTIQACAIAHKLGLFDSAATAKSRRMRHARNYTAWALFSWQSLMCFHYFRAPLVARPPEFPLPDPAAEPAWYGEMWLKYPLNRILHPSSSGDLFKARAEFAVILNDQGQRLFSGTTPAPGLSAVEVADFYARFKSWLQSLPDSLSPRKAVLPAHLKLHMHYFQIAVRLLQTPSILAMEEPEGRGDTTVLFDEPPQQILGQARASFETVLRAYYLRHGFERMDSYLVALLMEVLTATVKSASQVDKPDEIAAMRSTVILLAKGVFEQGQSLFLGQLCFQLVKDMLSAEDIMVLGQYVKLVPLTQEQAIALSQVQMDWPVQITSMADDPETKRLGDLVTKMRAVSLEPSTSGESTP